MSPSAKIIADSVSPDGVRITTMQVTFHRFVLAEMNTHRTLSRNSASSRAIPVAKQIERVLADPALPLGWSAEQKGMQGGGPLSDHDRDLAQAAWTRANHSAVLYAEELVRTGLHKSVVNRLLEPFMAHTAVITATAWENFFAQRCSPLAQPEIRAVADKMQDTYREHEPQRLVENEWHLPYIEGQDYQAVQDSGRFRLGESMYPELAKISAARCARVSYLTQDGKRDIDADLLLYDRLVTSRPAHWSPLEHVATPWPDNRQQTGVLFTDLHGVELPAEVDHLPRVGNLLGWRSLRTEVEAAQREVTYR